MTQPRTRAALALATAFALSSAAVPAVANAGGVELTLEPYEFVARDGTVVQAERGTFKVPERRGAPSGRRIALTFVRFAATAPKPRAPIVYLAGGPGGSGIEAARGERFPLFMALRNVADVIALDQRGTGASNSIPECLAEEPYPLDRPGTRELAIEFMKRYATRCTSFWREKGVDLAGYNTAESARDIEDLRGALGADNLSLWGISYGTHLALAVLKAVPDRIERVVLASAEGLDQTVKLPAAADAYFARLQAAIDLDPEAKAAYPDLAGLMRRVHARLAAAPAIVTLTDKDGRKSTMALGDFEVQLLSGGMASDPSGAAYLPMFYTAMDHGQYEPVAVEVYKNLRGELGRLRGMPEAMDLASGISPARLELVEAQAKTAILGDALNFPMPHLIGSFDVPDLGENFRRPVVTNVPALFLTGTLDGRTFPEEHAEIIKGFPNAVQVVIDNAGHNLFMVSPEVTHTIVAFMKGESVTTRRLAIDPPRFPH